MKKLKFELLDTSKFTYRGRYTEAKNRNSEFLLKNLNNGQIIGLNNKQFAFDIASFCGADIQIISKL